MKKSIYIFTAIFTALATVIIALCVYCFSGCSSKNEVDDVTALTDDGAPDLAEPVEPDIDEPDPDHPECPDGHCRHKGMPEVIRHRNGFAVGFHGNFHGGEFFVIRFGDCHDGCHKDDEETPDEEQPEARANPLPDKNPVSHRLPRRNLPAPVEP